MNLIHFWDKSYKHKEGLNGIQAIYINNLMRTLAWSLGGLFSPLYVFLLGYEMSGLVAGLKIVILSIIVERAAVALLSLPLGKLVFRIGFKWSVLLGSMLLSVYFLLPAIFDRSLGLILLMSVLSAFAILIYWTARLSLMSMDGNRSHYGHDVSYLAITERLVSILGPFVGGYIVTVFGFKGLFTVVTIVTIISALPMFFMTDHKITDGISATGFLRFVKDKKNRHLNVAFLGQGLNNSIDGFFWPIFFFLVVGSFELIGGVTSVITALTIVVVYWAGRKFDKERVTGGDLDEKSFTLATIWMVVLTIIRPLFAGVASIIGYSFILSSIVPFWWIPHDSYLYSAGKRAESPLAFYSYREIVYSVGRFLPVAALFFVLDFVSQGFLWWLIFALAALGILMGIGMRKES